MLAVQLNSYTLIQGNGSQDSYKKIKSTWKNIAKCHATMKICINEYICPWQLIECDGILVYNGHKNNQPNTFAFGKYNI